MSDALSSQMALLKERVVTLQEVASLQSVADLLKAGVNARDIMGCFSDSLAEIGRILSLIHI